MHLLAVLIFALSAGALPNPTNIAASNDCHQENGTLHARRVVLSSHNSPSSPQSSDHLMRRAHYGWIGSFDTDTCSGDPIPGPRPKLNSNCVPFTPNTTTVGISWGGWPIGLSTLNVYESTNCSGAPFMTWNAPQNPQGPGSCIDVGGLETEVGSVMNAS